MRRTAAQLLRLRQARSGATAVEFAFVAPLLLLLLLGLAEIGRVMWTQSALQFAVQEAARCAAIQSQPAPGQVTAVCGTADDVAAYAAAKVPALSLTAADFTVNAQAACGDQVTASVPYKFLLFGIFPGAPTLTAQACHV
jgi:Flp pilus assembly protein TadG